MNKNLISIAAAATLGLLTLVPAAHAADGQIDFTGSVIASSCTINGGAPSFTVTLPPVSTKALDVTGKTAGRVPVSISLSNCTAGSKVRAHFESGPSTNGAGRLVADASGAANVDLQLLNESFAPVAAGAEAQGTTFVSVPVSGDVELKYYVEYYSTGAATAGAVKSRVSYTIAYE
ncbi:major type 1 subunit fimbrin (pilin) [Variovorax boronicumulans]|uniref:Major type 1 subunit fimbrin (Pilin) n=1 Tax=Variovorax boronicumulans TaxID=436515 RepID=A0AAW8DQT9_9BURK|nr:fimbrial protein [Variovorax boronicumulans]MDP9876456.1 major type 1 subunit fimbrin (pilin) [Variovorax boronicumulans]MDP9921740.1 major type 1 subunit fimbrin (pilin) [Variovorax boronicumulans]